MNTTSLNKLLWLALCGAGVISAIQACSDDETTSTTAGPTTAPASSSNGAGGANNCQGGIDNPCEMCAAAQCTQLALECANLSMCDAAGEPTSGCLLLINCAATKCGGADQLCVAQMCMAELQSAGGIMGEGTMAAQALGDCVLMNCDMECSQGGAGGTSAGGAGGA